MHRLRWTPILFSFLFAAPMDSAWAADLTCEQSHLQIQTSQVSTEQLQGIAKSLASFRSNIQQETSPTKKLRAHQEFESKFDQFAELAGNREKALTLLRDAFASSPLRKAGQTEEKESEKKKEAESKILKQQWTEARVLPNYHRAFILKVAMDPTGQKLVTVGKHGQVKILDLKTQKSIEAPYQFPHIADVHVATISKDGTLLATADDAGVVRILNLHTMTELSLPKAHKGKVAWAAFSPDHSLLATAGHDNKVTLFDLKTLSISPLSYEHQNQVNKVDISDDGQWLISAGRLGEIHLLNLKTQSSVALNRADPQEVVFARFSPDSQRFVTTSFNDWVEVYDPQDPTTPLLRTKHRSISHRMMFTPDSRYLVGSALYDLKIWNMETMEEVPNSIRPKSDNAFLDASVTEDGSTLMLLEKGASRVVDLESLHETPGPTNPKIYYIANSVSTPDNSKFFFADNKGEDLVIWFRDAEEAEAWPKN